MYITHTNWTLRVSISYAHIYIHVHIHIHQIYIQITCTYTYTHTNTYTYHIHVHIYIHIESKLENSAQVSKFYCHYLSQPPHSLVPFHTNCSWRSSSLPSAPLSVPCRQYGVRSVARARGEFWVLHYGVIWQFSLKMLHPRIYQTEKLKFFGTNSDQSKISVWICTARYRGIWVSRSGGFREYYTRCQLSRLCQFPQQISD